jgi:hypothetical protein
MQIVTLYAVMYTDKTRKSYSLHFKRAVLKRLEENNDNIAQTAAEFNIHRKKHSEMDQTKNILNRAAINHDINTRTTKRETKRIRQGVSPYPLLDAALLDFIKQTRRKAIVAFNELYPESGIAFKLSIKRVVGTIFETKQHFSSSNKCWSCRRFQKMHRNVVMHFSMI